MRCAGAASAARRSRGRVAHGSGEPDQPAAGSGGRSVAGTGVAHGPRRGPRPHRPAVVDPRARCSACSAERSASLSRTRACRPWATPLWASSREWSASTGIAAYAAASQRRDIGVRLALGATRAGARFVRQALALAGGAGVVIGELGAAVLMSALASLLSASLRRQSPGSDNPCCFILLAGIAAYLPARRTTALDPSVTLRAE